MPLKIGSLGNKVVDVLWHNPFFSLVQPMHPVLEVGAVRSCNIWTSRNVWTSISINIALLISSSCHRNCSHLWSRLSSKPPRCVSFYGRAFSSSHDLLRLNGDRKHLSIDQKVFIVCTSYYVKRHKYTNTQTRLHSEQKHLSIDEMFFIAGTSYHRPLC